MPIPNLLHPVPIIVQQSDTANTVFDDDFREPVQSVARTANVTISGQVKWAGEKEIKITRGGKQLNADGYVLFRYVDLTAAGAALKEDDRIISIGGQPVDVYIIKFLPNAHYTDIGGPTMVKAFFSDRAPAKQRLDL